MKKYQIPSAVLMTAKAQDIITASVGDKALAMPEYWEGRLVGMQSDWGMEF